MLLGLAAGLAWAGGLYYWHFKVERAIRYIEDHPEVKTLPAEYDLTLWKAGCRAIPNLVRASKPTRPAAYLEMTTTYAVSLINREPAMDTQACDLRFKRREEMQVQADDSESVRTAKLARLSQWWTEHGAEVHQPWRFWSGNCRYPEIAQ